MTGLARPTAMATTGLARPTAMATTAPTAPTRTTMVLMRALTTTRRSTLRVRVVSRTAQLAKCGGTARAIPMAHLLGGSRASAAPRATAMATTGLARPTAMATTAPTAPTRTTMVLMRALTTTRRSTLRVRVVSRTAQLAKCGGTARAIPMAHLLGGSRASAAPRAATEFVASRVYLATTGLDGWTD